MSVSEYIVTCSMPKTGVEVANIHENGILENNSGIKLINCTLFIHIKTF